MPKYCGLYDNVLMLVVVSFGSWDKAALPNANVLKGKKGVQDEL